MQTLLCGSIKSICQNSLEYDSGFSVEGFLGITIDNKNAIFVRINEHHVMKTSLAKAGLMEQASLPVRKLPVVDIKEEIASDENSADVSDDAVKDDLNSIVSRPLMPMHFFTNNSNQKRKTLHSVMSIENEGTEISSMKEEDTTSASQSNMSYDPLQELQMMASSNNSASEDTVDDKMDESLATLKSIHYVPEPEINRSEHFDMSDTECGTELDQTHDLSKYLDRYSQASSSGVASEQMDSLPTYYPIPDEMDMYPRPPVKRKRGHPRKEEGGIIYQKVR